MNAFSTRRRLAAVAAGLAVAVSPLAAGALGASGSATPVRTAATSVDTTYLSDTFPGLSTNTILETVTYDRFQWLLQQPGQFAFLIGDTNDTDFTTKVVAAEAAAKAAGAKKIYWFDPNLSGSVAPVATGSSVTKNLDTRNPSGITTIAPVSQAIYGKAWLNILGQYLGNGYKSTVTGLNTESAVVNTLADDTVVNDATNPLWDYRSSPAAAPIAANADAFFVYDKDHTDGGAADKIVSGVNLSTSANVATDVTAAVNAVSGGGAAIDALDQFAWWKSEVNAKHLAQNVNNDATNPNRYGQTVLDDSDDADGWHVQQITYPELVHLLNIKDDADKNFVILFGGTWCPNTRAVIKNVNKYAADNNVTVYNFDTVLDGGVVGGGTTSSANPLQIRNTVNAGSTTPIANPSFLYATILSTYLKNIVTQYDLNNGTYVTYYANGDSTKTLSAIRKLQVPFLIDYQRGTGTNPSSTAIKRQWIQQNVDPSTGLPSFTEYMTQFFYANPEGTRIGLSATQLPVEIPIPADASNAPDSAFLTAAEKADPTLTDAAKTALVGPRRASVVQAQGGVDFGQEAVQKLDYFFGGLNGGVVSTQTVTAPTVSYGTAPKLTLAIENKYGRVPTGTATLTVGGKSYPAAVAQNAAVFTTDKLVPGSYPYSISYPGDAQLLPFTRTGTLTVTKGKVAKVTSAVSVVPTTKKAGKYKVAVTQPTGLARPTGKVTITLKKGALTKKVTGTLNSLGQVTLTVPKLAKGSWKVTISYAGDARYNAASAAGKAVTVKK